jgi:hypothetical protein
MALRAQALVALAGLVAAGALAGAGAANPLPIMAVNYRVSCSFNLVVSGVTIDTTSAPGVTIPPGSYQVVLSTPLPDASFDPPPSGCVAPSFMLSGPNVNWGSTLQNGEITGDQTTVTLLPSSTYTAVDENHPSTTQFIFSTAATGSSSSLLAAGASTYSGTATAQTQGGLIGSGIIPFRGSLHAAVTAPGRATLASHGKDVTTLPAGKYDIVVADASNTGGFFLEKAGKKPQTITTLAFEGKKTVEVYLSPGKWTFFSKDGTPTSFAIDTS